MLRVSFAFLVVLASVPAFAGALWGTVKDGDGKPLHGVMVRLTDSASGISESVYSGEDGSFVLETRLSGKLGLRLRHPYYHDVTQPVDLGGDGALKEDLTMSLMTGSREISDSLPAAYHFGSLPFEEGDDADFSRLHFQRDCLSCHQLGNDFSRQQRSPESWVGTITRMHLYLGNFDMELRDARSVILSEGFDGKPITVRPQFPVAPELARARLTEYTLEDAAVPHDAIYNPDDGLFYTVDQAMDFMAVTDPATGKTRYVTQAGGEAMSFQQGFSKQNPVFGEFNPGASHGPHSLAMGLDGKYYVTNTGTRSIGVFNPETAAWEAAHLMADETRAIYPHTIRVAKDGMVWFTLTGSEQVGRLDPGKREFKVIDLPDQEILGIAGTTQPYGIDINPLDGSIWYTRLFADIIGRIDAETHEVVEYPSPVSGPRRMHFDKSGVLWVTGYSTGQLGRIEADGYKTKVYEMPEFAPGYRPAPYALGVHPDTQDIWVNENMTDRIYRFIPSEERWVFYPVPLRGTYTRDMTFTSQGEVCTSNNPLPPSALEGGVLQLICIDPEYQPSEPRLAASGQ